MPGYKQTELGIVPEDWQIQSLPEALQFISGKAHEQFINDAGPYVVVNSKFISTEGGVRKYASENFCPAKRGDVLMVMSDLPNGRALAKCYLVKEDETYAVNQRVCIFRPSKGSSEYFYYLLNRNKYFMQFDDGVQQTHLLNPMILSCQLKVPPESEQYRIGQALTAIDSLISSLDQLITKKRNIKQAATQQLLTGKRRLPGFSGEWMTLRVCEMGEIVTGNTPKTDIDSYWDGSFPWVTPTDISTQRDMYESERKITLDGLKSIRRLPANSVLVTCIASIGKNAILRVEGSCNQQINAVIPNHRNSPEYLYYLFESNKSYLISNAGTTATSIISKATFSNLTFRVPPLEEQTAIATILSDMDSELAALESRRKKTCQLKQGMMQELLTGRTRLKHGD